jgi:hypothetical protein
MARPATIRSPFRLLTGLLLAAAAAGQEPASDPSLPGQLKDLRALVKDPKMEGDLRAGDLIQVLVKDHDKRNPKDLDKITAAIGEVFKLGKVRPPEQTRLYEQAGQALASLGKRGAKDLRAGVTDERIKDRNYARLRAKLIESLGRTKDEEQVDFLLEQALRSPDDLVIAAAGGALANFTELEVPKVRDVVKRLIGRYGEYVAKGSQLDPTDPNAPIDIGPQNARATLAAIKEPWNATLARLTGQSFSDAPDWQRWLNKNKDWQPPARKSGP